MRVSDAIRQAYDLFKQDPSERCRVAVRQYRAGQIKALINTSKEIALDEFNKDIWVNETQSLLGGKDITRRIFGSGHTQEHKTLDPQFINEIYSGIQSARLQLHGNLTWGTATSVFAPKVPDTEEKQKLISAGLMVLRDSKLDPMDKSIQLMKINGFGENISTGLVMHMHPEEFCIWNKRSKAALWMLGGFADSLETFQVSVKELSNALHADSFLELDWFLYLLGEGKVSVPGLNLYIGKKIAAVRAENSTFKRIEERRVSEARARTLIQSKLSKINQQDVIELLGLINMDWFRGKAVNTRFTLSFTGNNRNLMVEDWKSVRDVIVKLWDVSDGDVTTLLDELNQSSNPKGAGVTLYTALLYLRDSEKYNIWLPYVGKSLNNLNIDGAPADWNESYESFNNAAIVLRDTFGIQPEEVDLVLWGLTKDGGEESDKIASGFQNIFDSYLNIKNTQPFGVEKVIWPIFSKLVEDFKTYKEIGSKQHLKYRWGVGKGNWAKIPWIGFLDKRETDKIQGGVYVVYLFRQDMSGVYLTLNQGVSDLKQKFGVAKARKVLAEKAIRIRKNCGGLVDDGFILDSKIDLKVERGLGADYEVSTIAYKFYESNKLPNDSKLIEDLDIILNKYGEYVEREVTDGPSINFEKLRRVIDAHIEPLWDYNLDRSKLLRPGGGEYYVQNVFGKANPHLFKEALIEDPKENVDHAIKANDVLLASYESMQARSFVSHGEEVEIRDNLVSLIYSEEDLSERLTKFIKWSEMRPCPTLSAAGKEVKMGMNGTVVSYILAMANPNEYGFCKPECYQIAVEKLLGDEHVETDPVLRIIHCKQFYREILEFLMEEYGLVDGNLLDVHSIFNWLKDKDENGQMLWDITSVDQERQNWIFQAKHEFYDVNGAVRGLNKVSWTTSQHKDKIHKGDKVYIWESGPEAGICAVATVLDEPGESLESEEELKYWKKEGHRNEKLLRVTLKIDQILSEKLLKTKLAEHSALKDLSIIKQAQGTNFPVTMQEAKAIEEMMMAPPPPPPTMELSTVSKQFATELQNSHISFGSRHNEVVRSFVASLATKRLAILTGLSGSGKTQIAIKFGEWLGKNRLKVIPVRPDWTGPEPLFGFEDALQPCSDDGRHAWHVPEALEFMLRAARDPDYPYLLVLDEMNLAHVERYFADYLSGMESEYECLPNLNKDDGQWRLASRENEKLPIPNNLFVVGTVNIDETTYMFSPKVLDRGNTFEFRVGTEDLNEDAQKPTECEPGDLGLVRGFLEIAKDDNWQENNPTSNLDEFTSHLKNIHSLLTEEGFEFGHRTFYEAIRFSSMLSAAGSDDVMDALDLQIMQKVLPKLHGSRRKLEGLLCSLGKFCFSLETDGDGGVGSRFNPEEQNSEDARLPISFDKVKRMTKSLRANQFTSFTE